MRGLQKYVKRQEHAQVAGNICMDQFMIDVTDVPDVKVGDEVILMGSAASADGDRILSITAEEIGMATGTIPNEILSAFALRLPRIYKDSQTLSCR